MAGNCDRCRSERRLPSGGNERGLSPALRVGGYALATGMGFDVLGEFWPDIAHKLHMPFRDTRERPTAETGHSPQ